MTYNVLMGTLNATHSFTLNSKEKLVIVQQWKEQIMYSQTGFWKHGNFCSVATCGVTGLLDAPLRLSYGVNESRRHQSSCIRVITGGWLAVQSLTLLY